jgi:hypothetical protein
MITFIKNKFILISLILLAPFIGCGQNVKHLEIQRSSWGDDYVLIPHVNKGVVVVNRLYKKSFRVKPVFEFSGYDENFNKTWGHEMTFNSGLRLSRYTADEKNVYILFLDDVHANGIKNGFELFQFDIVTGKTKSMKGVLPVEFRPDFMQVMDGNIVWGGTKGVSFLYAQTVLLHTNMNTLVTKILELPPESDEKQSIILHEIKRILWKRTLKSIKFTGFPQKVIMLR